MAIHFNRPIPFGVFVMIFLCYTGEVSSQDFVSTKANIVGPNNIVINSFTGNLHYQREDLFIPGRGLDIELTFSYNTATRDRDWGVGRGWTFTYNMSYLIDSTDIVIERVDGRRDRFKDSGESFHPRKGIFDRLEEYEPDKYLLRNKNGISYYFEDSNHKKLTKIEDPNGNNIILSYTDSLLTTIVGASGRVINLQWQSGRLSKIFTAFEPVRAIEFAYDDNGNPVRVSNPIGAYIEYTYNEVSMLTGLIDENGNSASIKYNNLTAAREITSCLSRINIVYDYTNIKTHVMARVGDQNQISTYEYDDQGRLMAQKGNCCNNVQEVVYDENNNVIERIDPNGNSTYYAYDNRGNVIQEINALGGVMQFTYEENYNRLLSKKDRNGSITSYDYDDRGNLISINNPLGITEVMTYDEFGNRISYTNGRGFQTLYEYDIYGNLVKETNALDGYMEMQYNFFGDQLSHKDFNGNVSLYEYDETGRMIKEIDALEYSNSFIYDNRHNIIQFQNKLGFHTSITYNANDQMIEFENERGGKYSLTYDGNDNLLERKDPKGNTVLYEFDGLNRLVAEINQEGEKTLFEHDQVGNLTKFETENGNVIRITYDKLNRITKIIDEIGEVLSLGYDGNSNIIWKANGNGETTSYEYDAMNRVVSVMDPMGSEIKYTNDQNGNVTSIQDRNGQIRSQTFDELDRLASKIDNMGKVTHLKYDKNGNQLSVEDAKGNFTQYEYDELDRLIKEVFPDGSTLQYSLNAVDQVLNRTDNQGYLTTYEYDELQRLVRREYPDGTEETFTYDPNGNILQAANKNATVSLTYDKINRIVKESINGYTTKIRYDFGSSKRELIYPSGKKVTEYFDKRGRVAEIFESSMEDLPLVAYEYDSSDRPLRKAYRNLAKTSYVHDANARSVSLVHDLKERIIINYTYDSVGNRISEYCSIYPERSRRFEFDDLHRLTEVKEGNFSDNDQSNVSVLQQYEYDALGNRIRYKRNDIDVRYTSNDLNQYSSIIVDEQSDLDYDLNGNIIQAFGRSYSYDLENRLTKIEGGTEVEYLYDALGRRISKILNQDTVQYFYDFLRIVEIRRGSDDIQNFVYGQRLDEVIAMLRGQQSYYYHEDAIGSTRFLTDEQTNTIEQYYYDAFGSPTILDSMNQVRSNSLWENPFLFTGREYDFEAGQYFFRARQLHPEIGRFLQRDPTGFIDGFNFYTYVDNNPIVYTDPFGLWKWYGNWGGPGWTNGTNTWTEDDDFPRRGEEGYVEPIDERDECYYDHDVCLNDCGHTFCDPNQREQCRWGCDLILSRCLIYVPISFSQFFYGDTFVEAGLFKAFPPNRKPGKFLGN